jgi:hypothetical protein
MDELVIAQGILLAETFMARWAFKRFCAIMCMFRASADDSFFGH